MLGLRIMHEVIADKDRARSSSLIRLLRIALQLVRKIGRREWRDRWPEHAEVRPVNQRPGNLVSPISTFQSHFPESQCPRFTRAIMLR